MRTEDLQKTMDNRSISFPERKEDEVAFDAKLNKFIEKPLYEPTPQCRIISTTFYSNERIKSTERKDGEIIIRDEFFESGKHKEQRITNIKKDMDYTIDISRIKRFYENGLLEEVIYTEKSGIRRNKEWGKNGQLIKYSVMHYIRCTPTKTYKSLEWYDNGNLKSELIATDEFVRVDEKPEVIGDDKMDKKPLCGTISGNHEMIYGMKTLYDDDGMDVLRELGTRGSNGCFTASQKYDHINNYIYGYIKEENIKAFEILRIRLPLRRCEITRDNNEILRMAAKYGKVKLLIYLREKFELTAYDARVMNNYALRIAAEKGYAEVLKELREGYGLSIEDARAQDNYALRCTASFSENIEVLHELKEGYGLTVEDARVANNYIIRNMAFSGKRYSLKYMREGFGLTIEDARTMNNYALRYAAKYGHAWVIDELIEGYGLGIEDVRTLDNCALRWAAQYNHMPVITKLAKVGLTKEDAQSLDNYVIKYCIKNYLNRCPFRNIQTEILQIQYLSDDVRNLSRIFNLTAEDLKCIDYNKILDELVEANKIMK